MKHSSIDDFVSKGNLKTNKDYSTKTAEAYTIDLEQFCYWLDNKYKISFDRFEEEHVYNYIEELKNSDMAYKTVERKYASINAFAGYAGKEKVMNAVARPVSDQVETKKRIISQKEINKVLKRMEKRELKNDGTMKLSGYCYRAIVNMMVYCPLKGSEILNLKREDLDIRGEIGTVVCENIKTGVRRKVFLPEHVVKMIREYLEKRDQEGIEHEFLFISKGKKKIVDRMLFSMISKVGEECKIVKLNIRDFKNAYVFNSSKENSLKNDSILLSEKLQFKKNIFQKKETVKN